MHANYDRIYATAKIPRHDNKENKRVEGKVRDPEEAAPTHRANAGTSVAVPPAPGRFPGNPALRPGSPALGMRHRRVPPSAAGRAESSPTDLRRHHRAGDAGPGQAGAP